MHPNEKRILDEQIFKINNYIMKKRIIIAKFEIEDNDVVEQQLFNSLQCQSLKDFQKLPDTDKLYESDRTFRELCMKVKGAKRARDDYYQKKRLEI